VSLNRVVRKRRNNRKGRARDVYGVDEGPTGAGDLGAMTTRASAVDADADEGEWVEVAGTDTLASPRAVQAAATIDAPVAAAGTRPNATTVVDMDALDDSELAVSGVSPPRRSQGGGMVSPAAASRLGDTNHPRQSQSSFRSAWSSGSNADVGAGDGNDDTSIRRHTGRLAESHTALMTAISRAFDLLNSYADDSKVWLPLRILFLLFLSFFAHTVQSSYLCVLPESAE
jgi:hypothetical protein